MSKDLNIGNSNVVIILRKDYIGHLSASTHALLGYCTRIDEGDWVLFHHHFQNWIYWSNGSRTKKTQALYDDIARLKIPPHHHHIVSTVKEHPHIVYELGSAGRNTSPWIFPRELVNGQPISVAKKEVISNNGIRQDILDREYSKSFYNPIKTMQVGMVQPSSVSASMVPPEYTQIMAEAVYPDNFQAKIVMPDINHIRPEIPGKTPGFVKETEPPRMESKKFDIGSPNVIAIMSNEVYDKLSQCSKNTLKAFADYQDPSGTHGTVIEHQGYKLFTVYTKHWEKFADGKTNTNVDRLYNELKITNSQDWYVLDSLAQDSHYHDGNRFCSPFSFHVVNANLTANPHNVIRAEYREMTRIETKDNGSQSDVILIIKKSLYNKLKPKHKPLKSYQWQKKESGEWLLLHGFFDNQWERDADGNEDDDVISFQDALEECDDDDYFLETRDTRAGSASESPWVVETDEDDNLIVYEKMAPKTVAPKTAVTKTSEKKETTEMNKSESILTRAFNKAQTHAGRGLVRATSRKGITRGRQLVMSILKKYNIAPETVAITDMFLSTEAGEGLLAILIGTAMVHFPKLNENEFFQKVSDEMLDEGAAKVEGQLMDVLIDFMGPLVEEMFAGTPADVSKARIDEAVDTEAESGVEAVAAAGAAKGKRR